jgi:plasmid stabilization system protein ParE
VVHVIWTAEAINDLMAINDYIAQSAPLTAERFCLQLLDAPDWLQRTPLGGQVVPEFGIESIREISFRSYRIIYQVGESACYIRTVIHGSRDIQRHIDPKNWDLS